MLGSQYDRASRKRFFLYLDVFVIAVFFLAVGLMARDAYIAGVHHATGATDLQGLKLWHMARETTIVLLSLAWIFVRFFKEKLHQLDTPWLWTS